jgi:hypothetical protein
MISGAITAPFARTTPKNTIVMPNRMKFQVAISWMWRAIGSAGLCPPRNSASAGRSTNSSSTTRPPVRARLSRRPARVICATRSHRPAPIFCAAMALTAAPIAIAGICT